MRLPDFFPSSLKQRRLFILVTSIILLFILALQIIAENEAHRIKFQDGDHVESFPLVK